MGTWAVDAFGNDDAADWAYGLENVKDLSLVEATLDKAIASAGEYLEAPEAAEALAAIEVIARLPALCGPAEPPSRLYFSGARRKSTISTSSSEITVWISS